MTCTASGSDGGHVDAATVAGRSERGNRQPAPAASRDRSKKVGILVAGMHRSGTSAVARILSLLGCDLPRTLLAPHPSNERGFWESPELVKVSREILVSAGSNLEEWRADEWSGFDGRWYSSPVADRFRERAQSVLESEFGDSRLFVMKDPRLCRLLPFWLEALKCFGARPLVVLPIRNPLDVAESLEKRDGIDRSIGSLMWLQHVLSAEAASRGEGRAFLRYEQLLSRPHAVVDRLCDDLDVALPRRMSDVDSEIDDYLSPELRHHWHEDGDVLENPRLSPWIRSSFEILDRWANGKGRDSDTAVLDRIRVSFDEVMPAFDRAVAVGLKSSRELDMARAELADQDGQLVVTRARVAEQERDLGAVRGALSEREEELSDVRAELSVREEELGAARAELAGLQRTVADILASNSWRLTRPLRTIKLAASRAHLAIVSIASLGRRPIYLARRFYFYARAFGFRAACRRARTAIVARFRFARGRGATEATSDPLASLEVASVPRFAIAGKEEACPPVAMLVNDFHDGGLEKVVIDIAAQFERRGTACPILAMGSAGRAVRLAREAGCTVRVFDGNVAKVVSAVREDGIENLFVHHCYEPVEPLASQGARCIEVLHNAYSWQRDLSHLADLRARCFDRFVAVSGFVRDYAAGALGVSGDRIRVIENGLSRYGLLRPSLRRLCRRRVSSVDRPLFIHLANAHPQKNHVAILRAFENLLAEFPNARLVLAGAIDGSTDIGRRVLAEIEGANLQGRVRCSGPLERREVSRLLADAHVALLPSAFEGFSIASLEYAYFGLPTVLSDTGAARSLAERYEHAVIADAVAIPPDQLEPACIERGGLDPDPSVVAGLGTAMRTVLAGYGRFAERAERAGRDWEAYSIETAARRYHDLLMETVA